MIFVKILLIVIKQVLSFNVIIYVVVYNVFKNFFWNIYKRYGFKVVYIGGCFFFKYWFNM